MKRGKLWKRGICALCALALPLFPTARAAGQTPAVSTNAYAHSYGRYSSPVRSYLVEGEEMLTRVEFVDSQIVVETYDTPALTLRESRTIPLELTHFGGFYAGSQAYFFVFGQENPTQNDQTEVFRVVKYSKNWERLGQASVYGANTTIPFDAGSCRMAEQDGILFVRTSHEMYQSADGLNHQANLTFTVQTSTMDVIDTADQVEHTAAGYTSHSFNQFILSDGYTVVSADHGDAYPRAIVFHQFPASAAQTGDLHAGHAQSQNVLEIQGKIGDNATGATLGGLAAGEDAYLVAGSSVPQNDPDLVNRTVENIYFATIPKQGGAPQLHWLTAYPQINSIASATWWEASSPHLTPLEDDRFLLLWQLQFQGTMTAIAQYAIVEEDGALVQTGNLPGVQLSDCSPVMVDGDAVWYTTSQSSPVFYRFDPDSGTCEAADPYGPLSAFQTAQSAPAFVDVPADAWYRDVVEAVSSFGLMNGTSENTFSPDAPITHAEVATLAARVRSLCQKDGAVFAQGDPWYQPYWDYALKWGCIYPAMRQRLGDPYAVDPNAPCTRAEFACSLKAAVPEQILPVLVQRTGFSDQDDFSALLSANQSALGAMYQAGIISGMETADGSLVFRPNETITRAEAAAILVRLVQPEFRMTDFPTPEEGFLQP